jgi:topoisomerase-4 subunit A
MPYVDKLYEQNYLEYASYVIKDRAIPDVDDGLKPVQRRILHSLAEVDDGKFHKVANVVGNTMKYHPHGDQSIVGALIVLAQKDYLIEKQGNFGNIFTGDEASAARYIECRLTDLARDVLFNKSITEYIDTYDSRNKEPVVFPAKVPLLLILGTEGIAVGMSTKILPHNFVEVLEAQIAHLKGKTFTLNPDFPTGGQIDVSEYNDGNGKILVRAVLDDKDPKRIVIRELPFGYTSETLITSIEDASKKGKLKISSISDFTTEGVEIDIHLARGIQSKDTVDALFAFTGCENSISTNLLTIKDDHPAILNVTEVVKHATDKLLDVLKLELKLEERELGDRLHAKTLEQVFIENRIYKEIEEQVTAEAVNKAVHDGLKPFANVIKREVTDDDVATLLRIPIRRISLYDINKASEEMVEMRNRLREVRKHLKTLTDYAISYLNGLLKKYGKQFPRKTEIVSLEQVDVRDAAQRNLTLKYDAARGYLGYDVSGATQFEVSPYDRVLVIKKTGVWSVQDAPDRLFVDKGMFFCGFVDPERVYTLLYRDEKGNPCLKRFTIDKFILKKGYDLIPPGGKAIKLTTDRDLMVVVDYKPKPRVRVVQEEFDVEHFLVKGNKAKGVRLASREVKAGKFVAKS